MRVRVRVRVGVRVRMRVRVRVRVRVRAGRFLSVRNADEIRLCDWGQVGAALTHNVPFPQTNKQRIVFSPAFWIVFKKIN